MSQSFFAQKRPQFVFARRIADARGGAADQRQGLMAAFLEPAQHHQRHDMPDVQAVAGRIRAQIADSGFAFLFALIEVGVKTFLVGALIVKTPFRHDVHEL